MSIDKQICSNCLQVVPIARMPMCALVTSSPFTCCGRKSITFGPFKRSNILVGHSYITILVTSHDYVDHNGIN